MNIIMNRTEVDRVAAAWERMMRRRGYEFLLRYPSYEVDNVYYYTLKNRRGAIVKFKVTCWPERMQFEAMELEDHCHVPYRWDRMFSMC